MDKNNYITIVKILRGSKENEMNIVPCSKQFLQLCADAIEQLLINSDKTYMQVDNDGFEC